MCVTARPPSPTTTASRDSSVTRCSPTSRANGGARAPKTANASTGSEVSRPRLGADMPSPSRTSSSTGPTLTAAGRRLTDSRTSPTSTTRADGATASVADTRPIRLRRRGRHGARRAGVTGHCPGGWAGWARAAHLRRRAPGPAGRAARPGRRRVADAVAATRAMTCLHATEPASVHLVAARRSRAHREPRSTAPSTTTARSSSSSRCGAPSSPSRATCCRPSWGSAVGAGRGRSCAPGWPRRSRRPASPTTAQPGRARSSSPCAGLIGRGRPLDHRQSSAQQLPALDAPGHSAARALRRQRRRSPPRVLGPLGVRAPIVRGENAAAGRSPGPAGRSTRSWLGETPAPLPEPRGVRRAGRGAGCARSAPAPRPTWSGGWARPRRRPRGRWRDVGRRRGRRSTAVRPAGSCPTTSTRRRRPEPVGGAAAGARPDRRWAGRSATSTSATHVANVFDRNGNGGTTAWWNGRIVGVLGAGRRRRGRGRPARGGPGATGARALDAKAEPADRLARRRPGRHHLPLPAGATDSLAG